MHMLQRVAYFLAVVGIVLRSTRLGSLLAEVSYDEAKVRERRETLSPFSHFCLVVRDLWDLVYCG